MSDELSIGLLNTFMALQLDRKLIFHRKDTSQTKFAMFRDCQGQTEATRKDNQRETELRNCTHELVVNHSEIKHFIG